MEKLTQKQIELIEKANKAHQFRLSLGINAEASKQSLDIEIEHIKEPKLSEGRKND